MFAGTYIKWYLLCVVVIGGSRNTATMPPPPQLSKSEQKGRSALLNDICKKPKLKSSAHLMVDKSGPQLEGLLIIECSNNLSTFLFFYLLSREKTNFNQF